MPIQLTRGQKREIEQLLIVGLAITITAPIERVQLLLQCQQELIYFQRLGNRYFSAIDCLETIVENEGKLSLFRGNMAAILKSLPLQTITLSIYQSKTLLKIFQPSYKDSNIKKFAKLWLHGGVAGSIAWSTVYALDFARLRMATDIKPHSNMAYEFKSPFHVLSTVIQKDGLLYLFFYFFVLNL